jgi:hypothetical protein
MARPDVAICGVDVGKFRLVVRGYFRLIERPIDTGNLSTRELYPCVMITKSFILDVDASPKDIDGISQWVFQNRICPGLVVVIP